MRQAGMSLRYYSPPSNTYRSEVLKGVLGVSKVRSGEGGEIDPRDRTQGGTEVEVFLASTMAPSQAQVHTPRAWCRGGPYTLSLRSAMVTYF